MLVRRRDSFGVAIGGCDREGEGRKRLPHDGEE
jgi:hypothetical protein